MILLSRVHGMTEHVASFALKECNVTVPLTVPAAHEAVPAVNAPVRIDVPLPPVRIGVTVGEPASAHADTAVMVISTPVLFWQATGESLSFASTADAAPGSPVIIVQRQTLY